mmetsp:Transcript_2295/g.7577  ORF Transcript_2295/g.7577 Transcript_2295/m.7577 type:complete len:360 (+) Transcript_2295:102-1181(+)
MDRVRATKPARLRPIGKRTPHLLGCRASFSASMLRRDGGVMCYGGAQHPPHVFVEGIHTVGAPGDNGYEPRPVLRAGARCVPDVELRHLARQGSRKGPGGQAQHLDLRLARGSPCPGIVVRGRGHLDEDEELDHAPEPAQKGGTAEDHKLIARRQEHREGGEAFIHGLRVQAAAIQPAMEGRASPRCGVTAALRRRAEAAGRRAPYPGLPAPRAHEGLAPALERVPLVPRRVPPAVAHKGIDGAERRRRGRLKEVAMHAWVEVLRAEEVGPHSAEAGHAHGEHLLQRPGADEGPYACRGVLPLAPHRQSPLRARARMRGQPHGHKRGDGSGEDEPEKYLDGDNRPDSPPIHRHGGHGHP